MSNKQTLVVAALAGLLAAPAAAAAAQAQQTPTLQQLEERLDQQQRALEAQSRALERTRKQLEKLRIQAQAPKQETAPPTQTASTKKPVGKAPTNTQKEKAATVAAVMEQPGVLTPKGHFVLEPSLEYDYSDNDKVALIGFTVIPAIVVGLIDVREVSSEIVTASLNGRYGLTNRLELDVQLPFVYRHDSTIARPINTGSTNDQVFDATGHDIGDVQVGLRYQFNQGGPSFPYFIGSLTAILPTGTGPFDVDYATGTESPAGQAMPTELPTGSGFYGIQPGFQMIYPSDPAVLFVGANYLWRIKRDVDEDIGDTHVGEVDPGDSISVNFGMGMALNERSSFSIAYKHTYITKTRFEGEDSDDVTSSQVGQLLLGYGYQISPTTNFNLTVGAGLTEDAPDVSVTLRMPFQF